MVGRLMLIGRVAWLAKRTPKDLLVGWNNYWSSVRTTGVGGDVLWDTADLNEMPRYLPLMTAQMDVSLRVVDVGCGNGSFARHLAPHFPSILGVDLSSSAIALARLESAGVPNVRFTVLDATIPGATDRIAAELGPVNVFVRGVLHILTPRARVELVKNLLPLVGSRGRVFLSETNFRDGSLEYMELLGATPWGIPEPLERAIKDLPRPGHFGVPERRLAFPGPDWVVLDEGPSVIETIPLRGATQEPERVPGYFAVMAPRIG